MIKRHRKAFWIVGIVIVLIGALAVFFQYQNKESQTILGMTSEEKLSDFDTLCAILDECYPFWHEVQQANIDKDEVYRVYRDNIANTKTDIEFFKEISYFLKEFHGFGHLSVLDGYLYRLYLDSVSAGNEVLSKQEKQKIQTLVDVLTNPVSQKTYSLLDQSHEGFRSTIGLKEEYKNQEPSTETGALPQLETAIDNDQKAAYLKIDTFDLTNYQRDKSLLEKFYKEIEAVPNLIVDLRGNSGGSDLYWQDLIVAPNAKESLLSERYYLFHVSEANREYIVANGILPEELAVSAESILSQYQNRFSHYTVDKTAFDAAESPYKGKIWVLVDDTVYSASENFAVFCKNTGFATLVGTATGGDGGIADPMLVALPNSGLIVRFSVFYGINADGSGNEANGTKPDILITDGEDALNKCLELIE